MPPRPSLLGAINTSGFVCQSCRFRLWRSSQSATPVARCHYSRLRGPVLDRQRAPGLRPPQRFTPPVDDNVDGEEPVIRYYEQVGSGETRQLLDADAFSASLNSENAAVQAQIEELETKLADAGKLMDLIEKSGVGAAGAGRRGRRRRTGRRAPGEDGESQTSTLALVALDTFSKGQRSAVHALNKCLRSAEKKDIDGLDSETVLRVWKHYSAARKALSSSWAAVPPDIWDVLWRVLTTEVNGVDNRMHHVYVLATDMQAAGASLDGQQKLLAIEAMFIEGWEKEAMDNWGRLVTSVGSASETAGEYWALGLRMCCLSGDLERAERAADRLFAVSPGADPRILIPLIRACARDEARQERAWKTYGRLREALGPAMAIEDYDEVISCFLQSSRTEYALHAFVDMMFSGSVDMSDRTRLPAQVANQFFLGKWLKRLIGAGDLDGALSVLQYMEKHHVLAASIHLNGLIGAWMRSGTADNQQKAEDLAWAMVRSRKMFVHLRKRQELVQWPMVLEAQSAYGVLRSSRDETADEEGGGGGEGKASKPIMRVVPRANLETFSLLAENYRSRGLHQRLEELWVAARDAEISNGTFLVNQLLRSYSQQGQDQKAREFYEVAVKDQGIAPDGDTFLELFRSIRTTTKATTQAAYEGMAQAQAQVQRTRHIFKEMVETPWKLDSPRTYEWLPKMILHTLRNVGDATGLIVAVRAMRKLFNFVPKEPLLVEMALAGIRRRGTGPVADSRRLLAANAQIEMLLRQRVKERQADNVKGDAAGGELLPEEKADELSLVLERLLWSGAESSQEAAEDDGEDFAALFASAAEEMGVLDVVLEEDELAVSKKRKYLPPRSGRGR